MNYFLDTEFIEYPSTIDLISIGIVSGDGREFYMVNSECFLPRANEWVVENVLEKMPEYQENGRSPDLRRFDRRCKTVQSKAIIAQKIREFVKEEYPIFWGYFADYDWVVFCWLFGRMIDLPATYPMYCRDIRQAADMLGNPVLPPQESEHNALGDARWNKKAFEYLEGKTNEH